METTEDVPLASESTVTSKMNSKEKNGSTTAMRNGDNVMMEGSMK